MPNEQNGARRLTQDVLGDAAEPHQIEPATEIIEIDVEPFIEVAGKRFEATAEQPLLQRDDLHATPAGLAAIACVLVDELAQAKPEFGLPRGVDPAEVVQRAKASMVKTAAPPKQGKPANAGK